MNAPGNSNALIIAKRLGMPARMVKLAKGCLADRARALNEAMGRVVLSASRAAWRKSRCYHPATSSHEVGS